VVGTSIFLDIDMEASELKVLGTNYNFFLLERKHLGSQARIIKANSFEAIKEKSAISSKTKQLSILKSVKHQSKHSKSKYDGASGGEDDRKRDKKKKWKQHSKISV
jgi:hypothetical protein